MNFNLLKVNASNLLVLVPAFNESKNIEKVLDQLATYEYRVLVINDGSSDDTYSRARGRGVQVLDLPYNLGVGGALRAGFQYAVRNGFEAIVQIDADGQHPIDYIESLVCAANKTDAHLVLGSRFLGHAKSMRLGITRKSIMKVLARSASKATGTRITDSTSGFRLIRNPLLKKFSSSFASNYLGDTYGALISAGRSGYRVHEIPAPLTERLSGISSSSSLKSIGQTIKVLTIALLRLHTRI